MNAKIERCSEPVNDIFLYGGNMLIKVINLLLNTEQFVIETLENENCVPVNLFGTAGHAE